MIAILLFSVYSFLRANVHGRKMEVR